MNNDQLSQKIKLLANLQSLLGENPFKVRAFERAAHLIKSHPEEMSVLIDEDRLKDLKGIGDGLANVILHYTKSGSCRLEKDLCLQLPEGIEQLFALKGLGIKKIQQLWNEHQITNLEILKSACQENRLAEMKGFGAAIQQKLIEQIEFREEHARYFHLDTALGVADRWQKQLSQSKAIQKLERTGEIRRQQELIRQIDFVLEVEKHLLRSELEDLNINYAERQEGFSLEDSSHMPVQLHLSPNGSFYLDQLRLTGGDSYSEALNSRIDSVDAVISGSSGWENEQQVCQALDIQWLEPELRDHFNKPPQIENLIEFNEICGVLHAHSQWSDGKNTLKEMALATRDLGYEYLGITEHSQAAYYANGLEVDRVKAQWNRIDELNEEIEDFHIFKGIEADILPDGSLDYDEEILAGFDFVIASIHSHFHLDPVNQTDRLIRALMSPFTTMIGHPTGRMLLAREGYKPDLHAVIDAAAGTGKIIELNCTPKRLDLDWRYLPEAKAKGVKISINPDAHFVKSLETIPLGVSMARKGGLEKEDVLNTLSRMDLAKYFRNQRVG